MAYDVHSFWWLEMLCVRFVCTYMCKITSLPFKTEVDSVDMIDLMLDSHNLSIVRFNWHGISFFRLTITSDHFILNKMELFSQLLV